MIIKKSLADKINLSVIPGRNDNNFNTKSNIEFIESEPVIKLKHVQTEGIKDDSERFARGGEPRNIGGGSEILDYYSIIFWAPEMHRGLDTHITILKMHEFKDKDKNKEK